MKLTRQLLETHYKEVDARGHNLGLLVYGCAAHYLNLVEKEVTPRTVLSHLVEVAKYFRNHHQPEVSDFQSFHMISEKVVMGLYIHYKYEIE